MGMHVMIHVTYMEAYLYAVNDPCGLPGGLGCVYMLQCPGVTQTPIGRGRTLVVVRV